MAKIKPYTDYLYIKPVEKAQVLVSDNKSLQTYGEVFAVGPDVADTKVGNIVAFELWDKPEFEMNGETYHFVRQRDIICIIEPDALPQQ
jgi:co-chaperonin GroES (HSP10)